MDERVYELPEGARRLVQSIESLIAETQPLLQSPDVPPELTYTIRETAARYLPDTITSFLAIPASQRSAADASGQTAVDLLMEQLSVLDRSVRRTLAALSEYKRSDLAANARFLAERFDDRSTEIAQAADVPALAGPAPLPAWFAIENRRPAEVVASAAESFGAHLPGMTQVKRSGLFGMGTVEEVDVTLPQGGGTAFRYRLSAREGALETSVIKLVHGTVIQRVVCSPKEWLQSLYDDVSEFARRHHEMRAAFASLFNR